MFSTAEWSFFFQRLTALHTINVWGFPPCDFLDALMLTEFASPCPGLRTLRFWYRCIPADNRALHAVASSHCYKGCQIDELVLVCPQLVPTASAVPLMTSCQGPYTSTNNLLNYVGPFFKRIKFLDIITAEEVEHHNRVWWTDEVLSEN